MATDAKLNKEKRLRMEAESKLEKLRLLLEKPLEGMEPLRLNGVPVNRGVVAADIDVWREVAELIEVEGIDHP